MFYVCSFEYSEQTQKAPRSLLHAQGHWENGDRESESRLSANKNLSNGAILVWVLSHLIHCKSQIEHVCVAAFHFLTSCAFHIHKF